MVWGWFIATGLALLQGKHLPHERLPGQLTPSTSLITGGAYEEEEQRSHRSSR